MSSDEFRSSLSPSAQKVQDALKARGFENRVVEHEQTTRTSAEAAAAVGCEVGQIVKSVIVAYQNIVKRKRHVNNRITIRTSC